MTSRPGPTCNRERLQEGLHDCRFTTVIESHVRSLVYTGQQEFVYEPLPYGSGNRAWHEMPDLARRFLTPESPPTETALKSAVDLCYFAIYHALCHSNAQALAGRLRKRHTGRLPQGLHGHG